MNDEHIVVEVEVRVRDSQNRTASRHFELGNVRSVEHAADRLRQGFIGGIDNDIRTVGDQK